jgi:hypothetical protein
VDSTNAVTIVPVSGETLEGWPNTSPFPLATSGDFITCQSDGVNWQIIGGYSMTMMATGFAY